MLAGILFAQNTGAKPLYALICCAVCIALFFLFRRFRYSAFMVFFAVMFASMAYFSIYTAPPIANLDELGTADIEGRVCDVSYGETTDTYLLKDVTVNGTAIGKRIFLTTQKTGYELDDVVAARGELKLPASARFEHGFDNRLYCLSKNAAYTCLSYDTGYSHHASDLLSSINSLRYAMAGSIDELFGEDAPLVKAFVLGMDEDIEAQLYSDYRNTGISHVLVVSGLHVGLIYLALSALLKKLRAGRRLNFAVSAVGVLFFCALAGFSVSVVRAGLMCLLSAAGRFFGRRTDALTSLSLPFIICVIANPACVFGASMQLSYAAVFGILTVTSALSPKLKFIRSGFIRDSLCASLGATLGTAPILFNMNGTFYLPSVFINLAVVPFCSLLIPLTFAVTIIYCIFGGVTGYLAIPSRFMLRALNGVSRISSLSDFGYIKGGAIAGAAIFALFIILFILSKYIVASGKAKAIACGAFALCIAFGFVLPSGIADDTLTIVDVGNADLAVLRSGGENIVIDTGKDDGQAVRFLRSNSVVPDKIIITAADERKTGGLCSVLREYPDAEVLMTSAVREQLIIDGFEPALLGDELDAGDVRICSSDGEKGTRLIIEEDGFSCAFLEDGAAELPEADILKLYLRGKRQKYSQQAVAASGVQYALIAADSPTNEDTTQLLEGVTVINTYYAGTMTVDLDNKEVRSIYEG